MGLDAHKFCTWADRALPFAAAGLSAPLDFETTAKINITEQKWHTGWQGKDLHTEPELRANACNSPLVARKVSLALAREGLQPIESFSCYPYVIDVAVLLDDQRHVLREALPKADSYKNLRHYLDETSKLPNGEIVDREKPLGLALFIVDREVDVYGGRLRYQTKRCKPDSILPGAFDPPSSKQNDDNCDDHDAEESAEEGLGEAEEGSLLLQEQDSDVPAVVHDPATIDVPVLRVRMREQILRRGSCKPQGSPCHSLCNADYPHYDG